MRVQGFHQPERLDVPGDVDMARHGKGVNPRVGAPGRMQGYSLASDRVNRFLDGLLHRRAMRLPLQAHERAAVVFEN